MLLLATPMMPPTTPPGWVPGPLLPPGGVVCLPVVEPREGDPGCAPLVPSPWRTNRKSSPVIGSLYFLRRYFWSTSSSTFGGRAPGILRWNNSMARAYCLPRKTSSASFSRWDAWRQTGMATASRMDITLRPTSRATMAYPVELPGIAHW